MLICWGISGSFCTVRRAIEQMKTVINEGHEIIPVGSAVFLHTDTRFGRAQDLKNEIESLCKRRLIGTIAEAEPVGPVMRPDLAVIAPASGTTLAKLAHGVYDTPVTLAAKACLRTGTPLLLGAATNDALSGNFENIARLYTRKNIYFVPMRQDDPEKKPFSMVCDFNVLPAAICAAAAGKQLAVWQ